MKNHSRQKIIALCGGVGGAKLAYGLSKTLSPDELVIVVNTADDFVFHGMNISPDLDTVTYNLADMNNQEQGWGIRGETWSFMEALKDTGAESWFRLGDRDLVTHVLRTEMLHQGKTLTQVTQILSSQYGIKHQIIPMTDDLVQTKVQTTAGFLDFQEYFVKKQCKPVVTGFKFAGASDARPRKEFLNLLQGDGLRGIVICPSNPFVSIAPILSLPEVRFSLENRDYPVVAVSPIINGTALRGPATKMMGELGITVSSAGVMEFYQGLMDGFVVDEKDVDCRECGKSDITVSTTNTVMKTTEDKRALAEFCCCLLDDLRKQCRS